MDSKEELQVEPPPPPRRGGRLPLPRRRRPDPQGLALAPLLKKVRSYNPKGDMRLLERAYRFSEEAHDGQSRLSGAPFIEHPLAVAEILADLRLDTTTLTAALLHDTVEDTDVTLEVITEGSATTSRGSSTASRSSTGSSSAPASWRRPRTSAR